MIAIYTMPAYTHINANRNGTMVTMHNPIVGLSANSNKRASLPLHHYTLPKDNTIR